MRVKGRYFVFGWTAVFIATVAIIALRQYRGFALQRELSEAAAAVRELDGQIASIDGSIAVLSGRDSLGLHAQALGLHFVSDSSLVQITIPGHR